MRHTAMVTVVGLLAMVLVGCGAGGDEGELDPVVREVVGMLEAGAGSAEVEDWMARTEARPGPIGPAEERALERAGAPQHLIQSLREREGTGGVRLPPGLPVTAEPTPPATATEPPRLPGEPERTQMEPAGADEAAVGGVPLQLTVRSGGLDRDLVVALDGLPVLHAPAGAATPVTVAPALATGRHVLRAFLLEPGASTLSGARALAAPLVFEATAPQEWIVGLEAGPGGSMWTASRRGGAARTLPAGDPAGAQLLCPSGRPPAAGCVAWDELWTEVSRAPDLRAADATLRRLDLEPAPGS